ncbi:hypothetical protein M427DRAFT_59615 [Gonapodya prolifera JEL478]|uniref:Uncharacterized protein n=1 Tax=Gonapodya prolifera (strain JEL478) TaxID=1344416 RepID=A0A139A614_GONPJ|nr:hypothetical protein M427DRAFT_59615 [Gonapodya prolifera JEL478]|eukprot:KXS12260.1 hypothetical protein M427DRAFT_59615 [Gonapodya prolifera JEL478]
MTPVKDITATDTTVNAPAGALGSTWSLAVGWDPVLVPSGRELQVGTIGAAVVFLLRLGAGLALVVSGAVLPTVSIPLWAVTDSSGSEVPPASLGVLVIGVVVTTLEILMEALTRAVVGRVLSSANVEDQDLQSGAGMDPPTTTEVNG